MCPQHQGISELLSLCFYNESLKVTTKGQQGPAELDVWPGSRGRPVAFCHTSGCEETIATVTGEEMQESVCNRKEAEAVVRR